MIQLDMLLKSKSPFFSILRKSLSLQSVFFTYFHLDTRITSASNVKRHTLGVRPAVMPISMLRKTLILRSSFAAAVLMFRKLRFALNMELIILTTNAGFVAA